MGREPSPRGRARQTTIEFLAPDERIFEDESVLWSTGLSLETARFTGDRRASPVATAVTVMCALAILAGGTVAAIGITAKNDRAAAERARPGVPVHERNTTYDGGGGGGGTRTDGGGDEPGGLATPSLFDEPPQEGHFPVNPWILEVPNDANPVGYTLIESPSNAPGWFEFWAGPRAGRTVGRWLAVQIVPGEAAPPSSEATVVTVDGRELVEWTSRDGVAQIRFTPAVGWSAQLTAFGWSTDDLRALAQMSVEDGRPAYVLSGAGSPIPLSDELVISRPTSNLILEQEFVGSTVTSAIEWQTDDGRSITLTVATAQGDADTLGQFLVTMAAGSPISGPDVDRAVGTFTATAGRFPGLGDRNVVRWTDGADAIALTGDLPVEELLRLAITARPATGTEWVEIYEQVNGAMAAPAGGSPEQLAAE